MIVGSSRAMNYNTFLIVIVAVNVVNLCSLLAMTASMRIMKKTDRLFNQRLRAWRQHIDSFQADQATEEEFAAWLLVYNRYSAAFDEFTEHYKGSGINPIKLYRFRRDFNAAWFQRRLDGE